MYVFIVHRSSFMRRLCARTGDRRSAGSLASWILWTCANPAHSPDREADSHSARHHSDSDHHQADRLTEGTMSRYQIAQVNIARMKASLEDPIMAGLVALL